MSQTKFFIISSAAIFVLERALSVISPWPVFIFPVFVVLFGLSVAGDILAYLPHVAVAALFFDFFSGFPFGWFTLAILAVFISIYLAKTFFNINGKPPIFSLVVSLIFVFEYFLLLSIKTSLGALVSQAPLILTESAILLFLMRFLFQKFLNPKP
jgi:hypothetical protein